MANMRGLKVPQREPPMTRMRELRLKAGLSQLDLSLLVGVSMSYVSMLEKAPSRMSAELAARVAEALGATAEEVRR